MAIRNGAHIVVLGNEKGGSGKSTTAVHVIVSLLRMGFSVGALDLDGRQRSLTRYFENRLEFVGRNRLDLPMPERRVVPLSGLGIVAEARADERARFLATLEELSGSCRFVVIDCPGSDSFLSRLAHSMADTLITPMNDSFVDFDLLGRVDPETFQVLAPSLYSEMVWEARKRRAVGDRGSIDWIVMRNRLGAVDAHNKRRVGEGLTNLAKRIGFRLAPGFGERVIYREMFPRGLTLLDLREPIPGMPFSMAHVAARQEVRGLIAALKLPGVEPERIAV